MKDDIIYTIDLEKYIGMNQNYVIFQRAATIHFSNDKRWFNIVGSIMYFAYNSYKDDNFLASFDLLNTQKINL